MRHAIQGRKLNRNSSHRKALFINLSSSLLKYERIKTTIPKAKDLRSFVEKLITLGKKDSLANRRQAFSILKCKELVNKLFTDIGVRVKDRNGGYTIIMRMGFRTGDKAPMAIIELVDKKNNNINKSDKNNSGKEEEKKPKSKNKTKKAKA